MLALQLKACGLGCQGLEQSNLKGGSEMKTRQWVAVLPVLAGLVALPIVAVPADAQAPKRGGTLKFVVPDEPPSFDGHRETTFALIHPFAPFYSTLIRAEPENQN
jgi:peptide/nickel transport system substrate-binding protein